MERKNRKCKKYEVNLYFSGFSTYEIKARDKNEAIMKARRLPINEDEVLSNLENWPEADEATEIVEGS